MVFYKYYLISDISHSYLKPFKKMYIFPRKILSKILSENKLNFFLKRHESYKYIKIQRETK